jgi:exopolysaccharide biosynthesis predicted pyruvyltransferase EpsI
MGEEILLKDFGLKIMSYSYIGDKKNKTYFYETVKPDETMFFNGGGNFGDLYRFSSVYRNNLIRILPNNSIVAFPQTMNYRNKSLIKKDDDIYSMHKKLALSFRSKESYEAALRAFPTTQILFVPDLAFYIGNLKPITMPSFDIFILRRTDTESRFNKTIWAAAYEKHLKGIYTYLEKDWFFYQHEKTMDMKKLVEIRLPLVNQVISQGKIIITDRLHASIFSFLIGKPHIIINEKYKKIYHTRSSAFEHIEACKSEYLQEYYADDPDQAVALAAKLLS